MPRCLKKPRRKGMIRPDGAANKSFERVLWHAVRPLPKHEVERDIARVERERRMTELEVD